MNRINGTSADETLTGTSGDDEIYGLGGNDKLYTNGGHDKLYGGDGKDFLDASQRYDSATSKWKENFDGAYLDGGAGDDTLYGSHGDDTLIGGDGNDLLYSQGGKDQLYGGNGDDILDASQRYNVAAASWVTNPDGTTLDGGAGDDRILGSHGDDSITGGDGNDTIYSEGGKDQIDGGDGDDIINATQFWDAATSKWVANTDATHLNGGAGNDQLWGGDGNDTLDGGAGDDQLSGGNGDDTLDGGAGRNILNGGAGDDTYIINSVLDKIYDSGGTDKGTINVNWYKPSPLVENWTWAPGVQKLPYWLDAVVYSGAPAMWDSFPATHTIKYSFAQAPASFFTDQDKNGFTPLNADQIAYTKKLMAYVESVINVHFLETTDTEATDTIVFGNNIQTTSAGYASPLYWMGHGTLMLAQNDAALQHPASGNDLEFYRVVLHELAHSLGLKHPFADGANGGEIGPNLPDAENNVTYTVMSYSGAGHRLVYSPFDVAALQYLYGASPDFNAGDTTYTLKADSSLMIGDAAGVDTIDGSAQLNAITMYLEPGYWSHVGDKADLISAAGQFTVNFGTVIENALGGSGADQIVGNGADNVIDGGAGDDLLDGAAGKDKLIGGAGNDKLIGGEGNDLLDGGDGLDTAVFAAARSGFTVTHATDGWTITNTTGTLGTDTLVGVERVTFSDATLALDLDGTAAQAYRLYAAAFNRTPDMGGLGYWLAALDRGMSLNDVATFFTQNDEFTKMYGATRTPESFLSTLYQNILHRAPDQGGFDFWAKAMHNGYTEGQVLALFSESGENKAQVVGQIEHGIAYTPFGTA